MLVCEADLSLVMVVDPDGAVVLTDRGAWPPAFHNDTVAFQWRTRSFGTNWYQSVVVMLTGRTTLR